MNHQMMNPAASSGVSPPLIGITRKSDMGGLQPKPPVGSRTFGSRFITAAGVLATALRPMPYSGFFRKIELRPNYSVR
jgi:hypothetical protein